MANSISSVTTGTGGIVLESVDTSGNTNIKSGGTTIVAVSSTGVAVTGTLSASGAVTGITDLTTTGNTILGNASTDTLNVGNGDLVKDASGNVGIGTASPSGKLSVVGTSQISHQYTGATGGFSIGQYNASGNASINNGANAPLLFATNNTERARIDASGNLLVGTTSAVFGGGQKFVVQSNSATTSVPAAFSDTRTGTAGSVMIYFIRNTAIVGQISTTDVATTYSTSSDYRLKENIAPMTGALETVSQLKPCTYEWKLNGSAGQGFIAHELQSVIPDAVIGEKDAVDADGNPQYQGIDTSFLVATLTAAIQELKAIVDTQAEQIKALQGAK